MMFFNGTSIRTTPNYEVQKLFMNNVGTQVVPSTQENPASTVAPIAGKIGLSTWATSARYDNVKVTGSDGIPLFSDDFSGTAAAWTGNGTGSWSIKDGGYVQSSTTAQNTMVTAGNADWSNYTLSTKATKLAGSEGFLVSFGVKDTGNYFWWNLGGWNNTKSVVEKAVNGGKSNVIEKNTVIQTGHEYDIRIEVSGRTAKLYLDNVLWGTVDDTQADPVYSVVTKDAKSGDTIVKVVNTSADKAPVDIKVAGAANISSSAAVTTLTQTADGQNLAPATSTFGGAGTAFTYQFEPKSVTFIRLADAGSRK